MLYYIRDRGALVTHLANRLTSGGALSIVIRSETCVTYHVRSVMRAATSGAGRTQPATAPRVTCGGVAAAMRAAGLRVNAASVDFDVCLPTRELLFQDLVTGTPSTDATEFLRFMGHVARDGSTDRAAIGGSGGDRR